MNSIVVEFYLVHTSCRLRDDGEMVNRMVIAKQSLRVECTVHPVVQKLHNAGMEEEDVKQTLEVPSGQIAEPRKPRVCDGDEQQLQHDMIVSGIKSNHSIPKIRSTFQECTRPV